MKTKLLGIFVMTLLIATALPAISQIGGNVENERFNEKEPKMINFNIWEEQLTSYSEYSTKCRVEPFDVHRIYPKTSHHINSNSDIVYIFVPSAIYEDISFELFQYSNDLDTIGLTTEIYIGTWGTSEDVKSFLQEKYTENVVGCLMIGDIPCAWFELQAFDEHEEFPSDLYYMDLNGIWSDIDGDGIYDQHSNDRAPEIWIGRLKADVLSGDEIGLMKNYFQKCHQYRIRAYELPKRALVYIDDYWVDDFGYKWNNQVSYAYSDTDPIFDKWITDSDDYKRRLTDGYEMVHLAAHSSYSRHHFENPDGWSGIVSYSEIKTLDPHAFFYNLFCCSAARYIEENYIAGWYVFTDTYGLLAIGSTKVGGMWKSTPFYNSLGDGNCFGEAFKNWFTQEGIDRPDWFYGMSIVGDPTLPLVYDEPLENHPPEKPSRPTGETSGKAGKVYSYNTTTDDIDGDQIWYFWDWGDGTISDWYGPYLSNTTINVTHSWTKKGNYDIKVKAKDIYGYESDWSDPLSITMPKNKSYFNTPFLQFLQNFFEKFPNAFPILRQLLGL